jgi:hypothetical protein
MAGLSDKCFLIHHAEKMTDEFGDITVSLQPFDKINPL